MNTIKSWGLALLLAAAVLAPAPARAAALECDQQTTGLRLCLPRYGTDFDQWATAAVNAFSVVNSSSMLSSTSAVNTSAWLQTARLGGISTGPVGIWISSATTHTSSGTYRNVPLLVEGDSVTANAFFGDGSHLTGIASGAEANTFTSSKTIHGPFASTGTIAADADKVYRSTLGAGGLYVPYGVEAGTVQTRGQVAVSTTIGGNGNHRVRAGTGDGGGTTPIVLYSPTGSSTTGNTSATSWITADQFTVRPNSPVNDGATLEVFCVAKATSTNLTKGVETTINGTQTANGATTDTGARWSGLTTIRRTSATTADAYSERHRTTGFVSDAIYALSVTFANAFDVTCDIRASATAYPSAAGDENMDLKYMRVLLYPAP